MENKNTTIKVQVSTAKRIRNYEVHRRESNDEILNKILDRMEKKGVNKK